MALHPAATWVLFSATIVALFALASAAAAVPPFFDPCHEWGVGSSGEEETVEMDDACNSRSGSSQTRAEAALNLVAIQGVLLLAVGCIARGALRLDRTWTRAGATLIAAMVPPFGLGFLWIPALLTAALVFVAATRFPATSRAMATRERVAALAVALVGVGLVVIFLVTAGAPFLALTVAAIGAAGISATALISRTTPSDMNP